MEISKAYQNSLLAQAAYGDLDNGNIGSTSISKLTDKGMTAQDAEWFAKNYKVLDHYNATDGFSAGLAIGAVKTDRF